MLKFLRKVDIPFKSYLFISIATGLITILITLLLRKSHLPPQVPLFYGLAQGEEQIANSLLLTLPALLAVVVLIVNSIISLFIKDVFLKKVLVLSAIAALIFSIITTIKIIFLVGSF